MDMLINIDPELVEICREISERSLTDLAWSEIESSDMFQSENYCGGYDADESEFCFSYYSNENQEVWFQFGLETVQEILNQKIATLEARKAQ